MEGGTAAAGGLVRQLGGEVVGAEFAVELNFLHGRAKIAGRKPLFVSFVDEQSGR